MGSRVSYTLVGLFVVLLVIGLIAAGLWFGGGLQSAGKSQRYSVYTRQSVTGLSPGARVTYKGVDVGSVASVAIDRHDPTQVHLVLAVQQSTPVSADTVATLQPGGLTSVTSIELSGYEPNTPPPPTPPGEPYPVIRAQKFLVTQVEKAISEGIGTLNQMSQQFTELLSERNRQALTKTLSNFARLSGTLAANSQRIDQTLASLERLTQSGADATARLPKTLEHLDRSLQGLDRLSRTLDQTAVSLTALGHSGEAGLNRMLRTTVPKLEALFNDISQTTHHIDRLVQEIEREPAALLRGPSRRLPGPGEE